MTASHPKRICTSSASNFLKKLSGHIWPNMNASGCPCASPLHFLPSSSCISSSIDMKISQSEMAVHRMHATLLFMFFFLPSGQNSSEVILWWSSQIAMTSPLYWEICMAIILCSACTVLQQLLEHVTCSKIIYFCLGHLIFAARTVASCDWYLLLCHHFSTF